MNYVRRSFGAIALTFCGMLSVHADLAQVIVPVTDIVVNDGDTAQQLKQKAEQFQAALKAVLGNTLKTSLVNPEAGFRRSSVVERVQEKANALIDASKVVQKDLADNGFSTEVENIVTPAVQDFMDKHALIKKLPKLAHTDFTVGDVLDYLGNAAPKAKLKTQDMITLLNIAKRATDNADQKAALLKQRDELKADTTVENILNGKKYEEYINQLNTAYYANAQLVNDSKNLVEFVNQAASEHKYTLAEARIVARAAREAGFFGADAFDAQIAQAKTDIKARIQEAQTKLVQIKKDALVDQVNRQVAAAAKPGMLKSLWNKLPSMRSFSMPSLFSGKPGSGPVASKAVDYGVFADISTALNGLVVPDATVAENAADVVDFFKSLRVQAEAVKAEVTKADFDAAAQTAGLQAIVALIEAKYRACFANADAVTAFGNAHNKLTLMQLRTSMGAIKNELAKFVIDGVVVRNDFVEALKQEYNLVIQRITALA